MLSETKKAYLTSQTLGKESDLIHPLSRWKEEKKELLTKEFLSVKLSVNRPSKLSNQKASRRHFLYLLSSSETFDRIGFLVWLHIERMELLLH